MSVTFHVWTENNGIQQGVLQYWGGRNNNEHL
jgi:hypothetical protein